MREIGRGSFGVVYLAYWRGTVVAAKQIPVPSGQCGEALKEVQALRYIVLCLPKLPPILFLIVLTVLLGSHAGKFSTQISFPSWVSMWGRIMYPSSPILFKVPVCTPGCLMQLIPGYEDMLVLPLKLVIMCTISCVLQMDFHDKLYVAVQLAQALVYVHTATPPMVHGDVKPSNVLVSVRVSSPG